MVREDLIKQIKKELSILEKCEDILAVLLFGSQLFPEYVTNRSDIDICVVAPNVKNHFDLQLELYRLVRNDKYDIKVFELLP
ncbi:MAG: nucleotidyltransferase domain-containing protein, partial [Candidatus Odinarchaeota archaeon]|nr:nucleotidyltransferase domain-containing protein [Candidatus Odinarchaeota archaeon]